MGSMKDKRKNNLAPPYAAETKDSRFAGTFEVLVPAISDLVRCRELDAQP